MFSQCWFRDRFRWSRLFCATIWIALSLDAQTPTFEAASVKPAAPRTGRGGRTTASGDRFSYANSTLANLVARAYLVKTYQIDGPSWIRIERYDIVAKAPDDTPRDQIPLMLQALLMERFQLKLHREQREMAVYALMAGKGNRNFRRAKVNYLTI